MRKSVIISIVYPPTPPGFQPPLLPEGGEWRYHRLGKLPPNLKKNLKTFFVAELIISIFGKKDSC